MVRRRAQHDWLVQASAALSGAMAVGDYESADHLLAAIEAACTQGHSDDAQRALTDAYLLLDRVSRTVSRPA